MSKPGYCQHDAGVLSNGKISEGARHKFIQDVKDQLILGDAGLPSFPMPCGPELPPIPFADTIELEDPEKYPQFHEHWVGTYEKIALALDFQSQFMFLPVVMDPLALAAKLQLDIPKFKFPDDFILYGTAVPLLAIKLGFDLPVELIAKFPSILVPMPPIPNIPIPPVPPEIDPLAFPELVSHLAWPTKLPGMFLDLIVKMPSLFIGLLQGDFKPICDVVLGSGLFGDMAGPGNTIQVAAAKVLARKVAECTVIAIVGGSVGSSSGGITGALGKQFGYVPPPPPESSEIDPRERIVASAKKLAGKSWSTDNDITTRSSSEEETLPYTEWMLPVMSNNDKKDAFAKAKYYSSCGLFVRGCYFRGGASDGYFTDNYKDSTAISGLVNVAQRKGALIPFGSSTVPALKKGDSILVYDPEVPGREHVLIVSEDHSGGFDEPISGIEGGQADPDNEGRPTAVATTTYNFFRKNGGLYAGPTSNTSRKVLKLIDAEKIVA